MGLSKLCCQVLWLFNIAQSHSYADIDSKLYFLHNKEKTLWSCLFSINPQVFNF